MTGHTTFCQFVEGPGVFRNTAVTNQFAAKVVSMQRLTLALLLCCLGPLTRLSAACYRDASPSHNAAAVPDAAMVVASQDIHNAGSYVPGAQPDFPCNSTDASYQSGAVLSHDRLDQIAHYVYLTAISGKVTPLAVNCTPRADLGLVTNVTLQCSQVGSSG